MAKKLGTIMWEEAPTQKEKGSVPDFKKFCLELYPKKDKTHLDVDVASFSSATQTIFSQFEKFAEKISSLPLLAVILFWADSLSKDKSYAARSTTMMKELITEGYIGLKDTRGQAWTLKHMISIGHDSIIEAIRCNEKWSLDKIEEHVKFYISFVNWLSEKTLQLVPQAYDPDLQKTKERKISHSNFITIIKALAERERVIAELLYFGGSRTLEEVLSLKVEDALSDASQVTFATNTISYPKHVLIDLQNYIGAKKRGYIFVGRNKSERIDGTVPYRVLKLAIAKLKLDPSFTFKDFTKNS